MVPLTGVATDDFAIAKSAREHLHRRLDDSVGELDCEFTEGVLVLRGRTRSFYHKQLAQESVRSVKGVTHVENRIEVCVRPR